MLSRVSIIQQIQQENGDRVSELSTAVAAAQRAHDTAVQQAKRVTSLSAGDGGKEKQVIQGKVNTLNSAAFAQAMTIFEQDGELPEHQPAHREHGRRGGAAVRDDPAR